MGRSGGPARCTIVRVPTRSPDDAFAEVKSKVDLVEVVQEHVRLTKRNKDYWGLCPFHQEDSPSFHVNPQRQSWYCFGCERKGDVFTFVELIEKTDKRGALLLLAERAGVELKQLSPEQKDRADVRKRVLALLKLAAQYYEYVLWKSPAGEPGRRLLESRRVDEETARRFQLGYAPAGRGEQRGRQLRHRFDRGAGAPPQALHRRAAPGVRFRPRGAGSLAQGLGAGGAARDANSRGGRAGRQGSGRVPAQRGPGRSDALGRAGGEGAIRLRGRHGGGLRRPEPEQPEPGRARRGAFARVDQAVSGDPAREPRGGGG